MVKVIFIFKLFSLETARPIEAKFHVEPPWDGGMKVCSNGPGHMTKMATMLIYGKNLKNSSSLEPNSQWPWKLVYNIEYSSTTKFIQMMTLGWLWPYFTARSNLGPYAFVWEKGKKKTTDFQNLL